MLEQWELVIIASVPTYLNISMNAGILMKKILYYSFNIANVE